MMLLFVDGDGDEDEDDEKRKGGGRERERYCHDIFMIFHCFLICIVRKFASISFVRLHFHTELGREPESGVSIHSPSHSYNTRSSFLKSIHPSNDV